MNQQQKLQSFETFQVFIMGTTVYLVCIVVAPLAQPAVAQGDNITLPITYTGQVVQGDDSQSCPSVEQKEMVRNEVDNATQTLLRESVVPALQATISCGGCSLPQHV